MASVGGARPMIEGVAGVEVINLARRPDRLAGFRAEITSVLGCEALESIHVREAVDGLCLVPTPELWELFGGNWFGSRRLPIATTLSHTTIWADAVRAEGPVLVFEDDVSLAPDFRDVVRRVLAEADERFPLWDMILLGHFFKDPSLIDPPDSEHLLSRMRWDRSWGGLYCHLLSPTGAARLLELADTFGFVQEVDNSIAGWEEHLQVLEINPHVAFAQIWGTETKDDRSDLWFG